MVLHFHKFDYDKIKNILIAKKKVKIIDKINNIIIYSDKITYFKNDELILASGNSKALDDDVQIDANNFKFDKLSKIIYANGDVKINNQKENYLIYSDKITYFKNDELILASGNSKALDDDVQIDANNFKSINYLKLFMLMVTSKLIIKKKTIKLF